MGRILLSDFWMRWIFRIHKVVQAVLVAEGVLDEKETENNQEADS